MREYEFPGQMVKKIRTGVFSSFVIVSPRMRPNLFTKNLHGMPGLVGQRSQLMPGAKAYEDIAQIKENVSDR